RIRIPATIPIGHERQQPEWTYPAGFTPTFNQLSTRVRLNISPAVTETRAALLSTGPELCRNLRHAAAPLAGRGERSLSQRVGAGDGLRHAEWGAGPLQHIARVAGRHDDPTPVREGGEKREERSFVAPVVGRSSGE